MNNGCMSATDNTTYDVILVGLGTSGGFLARHLSEAGLRCLALEAGQHFARDTYPRKEVDANALMYWGGGIELNHDASIGLLRPRVVGGGSIVNGALMDRFDDDALDAWRATSGVKYFERNAMDPWYGKAETSICLQEIPSEWRNRNAEIFRQGFENNGYRYAPLRRAQSNCRYQDGNDCIVCLWGCPIDSKQSMAITMVPQALAAGLTLVTRFEAARVEEHADGVRVHGHHSDGREETFAGRRLILASGAIGNSKLLLASGFGKRHPTLGQNFYSHPQYMELGLYAEPVEAHRGPLQSLKSAEPNFRRSGFKLENVYAPPGAIAMLVPGYGKKHLAHMRQLSHMACIEVCVRDTNPGRIRMTRSGGFVVEKSLNAEDRKRRDNGLAAIHNIFLSTGAKEIISGKIAVSLHLMGGCGMGVDASRSVVAPDFHLHGSRYIYAADSSIFPNAPGINPALTIMALSLKATEQILADARV